ncbi:hypothetical protein ACKI1I_00905 [Streptomyces turgidiscabies]|uniref:Uncharacterized protein n=1 Tax=Streptomyces turgidiscabies (strain Car8) TaxID=698760 RepID=L7FIR9_STRT8|nr:MULTISPECIES: hypothetical protein [Streptomyces]ELP71222.1 hypothetical protein STRTUCAR8_05123 [Streptomyces turgidiscabies Car8]MDX3492543.1 hypothetical protein [Streptomyces turgidiscabies]GAQ69160.1 hypothetical protein T45_00882 [Streptomyces turgidiscabies]
MSEEKSYPLPRAVIFDDTAALALGAGNSMASRLVVEAEKDPALKVYVPALSLAAAEFERAGVAEHVGALPSVTIEGLDFAAATAVGKRMRVAGGADAEGDKGEADWSGAHVLHLALPTVEWPRGRPVLTRVPTRYRGTGIRTIRVVE